MGSTRNSCRLLLDVGGTFLKSAVADAAGQLLSGSEFSCPIRSEGSREEIEGSLAAAVARGAAFAAERGMELAGIGIAIPGPFDYAAGVSRMTHKFRSICGVDLRGAEGTPIKAMADGKVVIAQFLKGADSGERVAWKELPNVTLLPVPEKLPFLWDMTVEERKNAAEEAKNMLQRSCEQTTAKTLLVLDELCGAVEGGLLSEQWVTEQLQQLPQGAEVVVTGRNPPKTWLERADYATEMCARKHPYAEGVQARKGVEY